MRGIRATMRTAVACLITAGTLTGCDIATKSEADANIVIAADLELTGTAAPVGTAFEQALRLKIEQLNNDDDVLGGRKIQLEVRDNRSDTNLSLRNIGEFVNNRNVTALVTGDCTPCVMAASRTINNNRMPTISLAPASRVSNPVADRRYIFKLAPNAADTAAVLTAELNSFNVKTVGLLLAEGPYGDDGEQAMKAELRKAGITIRATRRVRAPDTELGPPVEALVAERPGALVVWTTAAQAGSVATSARAAGFKGPLYFDAAAAGDLFLTPSTSKAVDGAKMFFPQTMVIDDVIATTPAKVARKQWFRDYTARYGSYVGHASFAADAVQLIVDAVGRVGLNRDRIRDVLETSQLDGLSGPIRLTPDNHSGLTPQALTLLVARSGRWRLAG